MKKVFAAIAVMLACLTPLRSAKADGLSYNPFCTTGLVLNFCGSIVVTATPNLTGGSHVVFQVLNTSGGPLGGDPLAVFTAIGLENVSNSAALSNFNVSMNGTDYTANWQLNINKTIGGGVNVDILSRTDLGIQWGISSACGPIDKRITTGGIGNCGYSPNYVTISFDIADPTFSISGGNVFVKAQGNNSSECLLGTACSTTTTPEPATIFLVGSGLMSLGGMSRWRRRRDDNA